MKIEVLFGTVIIIAAFTLLAFIGVYAEKDQVYLNEDHKIYCFTAEERWASYEHLKQENCINNK